MPRYMEAVTELVGSNRLEDDCARLRGLVPVSRRQKTVQTLAKLASAVGNSECSSSVCCHFRGMLANYLSFLSGGVAERLKAPVLKTGRRASVSRVQIPPPPPVNYRIRLIYCEYSRILILYHFPTHMISIDVTDQPVGMMCAPDREFTLPARHLPKQPRGGLP